MARTSPASHAKNLPWALKDELLRFVKDCVQNQYPHHAAEGCRAPCGGTFLEIKVQYLTDNHALGLWLGIVRREYTIGPIHMLINT